MKLDKHTSKLLPITKDFELYYLGRSTKLTKVSKLQKVLKNEHSIGLVFIVTRTFQLIFVLHDAQVNIVVSFLTTYVLMFSKLCILWLRILAPSPPRSSEKRSDVCLTIRITRSTQVRFADRLPPLMRWGRHGAKPTYKFGVASAKVQNQVAMHKKVKTFTISTGFSAFT